MWKERIVFYVKRKNYSDFNLWTTSNYRTFFIADKAQDKVVLLGKMSSGKKIDSESINIQISNLTVNFKIYF